MKTGAVILLLAASYIFFSAARAESVYVKYRGNVDLDPFVCTEVTRSSFIRRVCYDSTH